MTQETNSLSKMVADKTSYDKDSEEHHLLMEELEGVSDQALQILLDGLKVKSTATVSPEVMTAIQAAHDAEQIPTAKAIAETLGSVSPASVRSALSTLSRNGEVATFKGLKMNNELMIFPAGTTEEDARAAREQIKDDPANWKPDMQAIFRAIGEIREDGDIIVTMDKIAEHTGIKVASVASNISVLNVRGYVTSTDLKWNGRKVLFPTTADVEAEAAEIQAKIDEAKQARKTAQKQAELETGADDDAF